MSDDTPTPVEPRSVLLRDLGVLFRRFNDRGEAASAVVIRDAIAELSSAPRSSTPQVLLSAGWLDVGHERKRQVEVERWTPEHDDEHGQGELAMAASCYAELAGSDDQRRDRHVRKLAEFTRWPWARTWWKPKDRRADLVRAGALIIAEIDRLDRKAAADLNDVSGRLA